MEEIEEIKFEELDELLDEIEDLEEIKDVKDCSFNRFYAPIRSLFSSDSQLLDKFSLCKDHNERLRFLVEMEVMIQQLLQITENQNNILFFPLIFLSCNPLHICLLSPGPCQAPVRSS